ncbi:MAG: ABC-type transport auxiliary lipoprotein family protein [Burkholderiales bacterium]
MSKPLAHPARRWLLLGAAALVSACTVLQEPQRPAVYDFGPPETESPAKSPAASRLPSIALADVDATQTLDGNAVLYRLGYANDQQLRPYALARWSAPPAQLVRQRVRERLSRQRSVIGPLDPGSDLILKIELDEFSQLFEAPTRSFGLVRLTATVSKVTPSGEKPIGQRNIVLQRPATTPDAAGGVKALAAATDAAADDIAEWLKQIDAK